MKNIIHAYQINPLADYAVFRLPKGAQILEIGNNFVKGGVPTLWAMVNPDADPDTETETRVFCRFDCGAPIAHDPAELFLVNRMVALGKSASNAGNVSARNTFWFEATGKAAAHFLEIDEALNALI